MAIVRPRHTMLVFLACTLDSSDGFVAVARAHGEQGSEKQTLSARARSIFSPVFSPVLNLFKKDTESTSMPRADALG